VCLNNLTHLPQVRPAKVIQCLPFRRQVRTFATTPDAEAAPAEEKAEDEEYGEGGLMEEDEEEGSAGQPSDQSKIGGGYDQDEEEVPSGEEGEVRARPVKAANLGRALRNAKSNEEREKIINAAAADLLLQPRTRGVWVNSHYEQLPRLSQLHPRPWAVLMEKEKEAKQDIISRFVVRYTQKKKPQDLLHFV